MSSLPPLILAEYLRPMFGNQWLALGAVLIGVAVFMVLIALVGRWLAATHPEPAARAVAPVAVSEGPSHETLAIITACVAVSFGNRARITAVVPGGPSVETLMQQWSLEGRRQIYSSHQVR